MLRTTLIGLAAVGVAAAVGTPIAMMSRSSLATAAPLIEPPTPQPRPAPQPVPEPRPGPTNTGDPAPRPPNHACDDVRAHGVSQR